MALLSFARNRYKGMKDRERQSIDTQGRRIGGWGVVEVDEDKRRWIYEDDKEGLQKIRDRDARSRQNADKADLRLDAVQVFIIIIGGSSNCRSTSKLCRDVWLPIQSTG